MSEPIPPKILKNERHHWWPKVVSRHWADVNGRAHQISSDGKTIASKPENFGAIRNDNNIRMAREPTVWDHSFEGSYAAADNAFATVIPWLKEHTRADGITKGQLKERLSKVEMPDAIHAGLAECLASLIARSPMFRHRVRLTTEYYRGRMGLKDAAAPAVLVRANVAHCQTMFRDAIRRRGKFALLSAGESEFIFGDGFLSNFSGRSNPPNSPECLVPITPEVAVYYKVPMQFRTDPKTHSLTLSQDEVRHLNDIVQVYSKRFVFYRSLAPKIIDAFTDGEHRQLKYDKDEFLQALSVALGEIPPPPFPMVGGWLDRVQ